MRPILVRLFRLVMGERMKSKKWKKSKEACQELKWVRETAWDYYDSFDDHSGSRARLHTGSNRAQSQLSISSSMISGIMPTDLGSSHSRIF